MLGSPHTLLKNKGDTQPIVHQEPIENLHALLVGINSYIEPINHLSGCVNDANSVEKFLRSDLRVPEAHITILRDNEATRFQIIDAIVGLSVDPSINRLDPILIYFAGHGANLDSPLVDYDEKVQCLVPSDAGLKDMVPAIPDYIIADLLADLAEKKGNNIASASSTRGLQWPSFTNEPGLSRQADGNRPSVEDSNIVATADCQARSVKAEYLPPLTEHDDDVTRAYIKRRCRFKWRVTVMLIQSRLRGYPSMCVIVSAATRTNPIFPQPSYGSHGFLGSHTLFAACGQTEGAVEQNGKGLFTTSLIAKFRSTWLGDLTPRKLFQDFPQLYGGRQSPVCEGANVSRVLFRSSTIGRGLNSTSIQLQDCGGRYLMKLGDAQGVLRGSKYDIYEDRVTYIKPEPSRIPLYDHTRRRCGTFMAEPCTEPGLYPFYSWCKLDPKTTSTVPANAYAIFRTRGEDYPIKFKVFMSDALKLILDSKTIVNTEDGMELVVSRDDADLVLEVDYAESRKVTFEISGYSGVVHRCHPDVVVVHSILLSMAKWHWHLSRKPQVFKPKRQLVQLELHLHRPGRMSSIIVPEDGAVNVTLSPNDQYLLKLRNLTSIPLYPYLFYLSTRRQSIRPLYLSVHGSGFVDPPVAGGGELTFGHGNDNMIPGPLSFHLAPDVGYFRLFLTTLPGDFDLTAQVSPLIEPSVMSKAQLREGDQYLDGLETQRSRSAAFDLSMTPKLPSNSQDIPLDRHCRTEANAVKVGKITERKLVFENEAYSKRTSKPLNEFFDRPTDIKESRYMLSDDQVLRQLKSNGKWAGRWDVISLKVILRPLHEDNGKRTNGEISTDES